MLKPSFPSRARTRHRTPLTRRQAWRLLLALALGGVTAALFAAPTVPLPIAAAVAILAAVITVPLLAHDRAPQIDTPHQPLTGSTLVTESPTVKVDAIRPAADLPQHDTALAEASGAYGKHSKVLAEALTTAIPAVKA